MRIAFTSCADVLNDPVQAAWTQLAAQQPDRLLLLGDNIYVDYAWGHPFKNGEPKGKPLDHISSVMYDGYRRQWEVATFRAAIADIPVDAIWDDHDFAWNDARGGEPPTTENPVDDVDYVSPDHRRLSRALFEQFRGALLEKPTTYPANPYPSGIVNVDLGGIQQTIDLAPDVRLHLLDGRTFREAPGTDGSILGLAQRTALTQQFLPAPHINILASGSTVRDWRKHSDRDWVKEQAQSHRILVLSGDIHEPQFVARYGLFEATASAVAQPPKATTIAGKKSEVFGILDISETELVVTLWHKGSQASQHVITRATWANKR